MQTCRKIESARATEDFTIIALVVGFSLSIAGQSMAHVPYIEGRDFEEGEVFEVPGPLNKSIAVMAHFHDSFDIDVAAFTLSADDLTTCEGGVCGTQVHIGSMVPACTLYVDVLPSVALVGPQQASLPSPGEDDDYPFEVEWDEGVTVVHNDEQGEKYYEPFTMKSYYRQNTAKVFLTEPGTYWIYYWEPGGAIGDYVMEVGDVEIWGLREIIQALRNEWYLIHDREIHNKQCRREL